MRQVVVFILGLALALVSAVALQFSGTHPTNLWWLFLLVSILFGLLPKLKNPTLKLAILFCYGSLFALFWVLSSDISPVSSADAKAQAIALALVSTSAAVSVLMLIVAYAALPPGRPTIRAMVVVIVLTTILAYVSSARGGAGNMITWFMSHLGWDRGTAETGVLLVRKTIHFVFYGTFAYVALRFARLNATNRGATIAFALLFALLHATFDELRQGDIPSRTGSAWDVGLDMLGAAAFVGIASRAPQKRKASKAVT